LESLKKEESPGLMSLQLGALADNLLQLEQVVNNALLKLVLEVSFKFYVPKLQLIFNSN
jgi:hypothetical protein